MNEKDMVNDTLTQLKSSLTGYQNIISEASNQQFRQEVKTMRDNCEKFHFDLYNLAEQKGYYQPAGPANQSEVQRIKNSFTS